MATRRQVLGASLTAATVLGTAGAVPALGAAIERGRGTPRDAQALFVSESIALPEGLRFMPAPRGRQVPIIGLSLAPEGYRELKRVLGRYQVVAGLSSGAALFCIERIAWDHGLRLAHLEQHEVPVGAGHHNARVALEMLHPASDMAARQVSVPAYRPSRTDGILHAWILERADLSRSHYQSRQEFA